MGGNKYGLYYRSPTHAAGHDSIWVIVDRLTKSAHFVPINIKYPTRKHIELYVSQIMRLHGVPRTIISDWGPQFIACFLEH